MDYSESSLEDYLVLYRFDSNDSTPEVTFYIQLYPGYGYTTNFKLLHEKGAQRIRSFQFSRKTPFHLHSFPVEEGDIVYLRAMGQDGTVVAGGIWQLQWRNDEVYGGFNGYIFEEITSFGIEMVKVEKLLQEEDFILFEDAIAKAEAFLESQADIHNITFLNGREIGNFTPERFYQITSPRQDIRSIEHTWLLVFSGGREYTTRPIFLLLEVCYHFQTQHWQFSTKILKERDNYETEFL